MKVVVIGNGKVGEDLSSALVGEGHDVTIVDSDPNCLTKAQNTLDVMCIDGNGATAETQLEAGVDKAGLFIAATPYDELNILACLIAKRLGARQTISRVQTPEYYRQMHLIRDDLRLSMIINPELVMADEIFRILIFPSVAKVEVFDKGKLELVEYHLPDKTSLAGLSLQEIYKKVKTKFLICVVQRNGDIYIPDGNFILQSGDRIHIAANHKNIERFFRVSGFMKDKVKSVMIVGGGTVCYYLAQQLINLGMKLKIIEKDKNRCMKMAELLPKAVVIHGDGTDQDLLIEEGIRHVDAFVVLTDMDEENMILALFAKNTTNAKVITKINRDNYLKLVSGLELGSIISPKYLITNNVLSYVRSLKAAAGSEIESLYHLVGNQVEAIEFRVRDEIPGLVGIPLKDVTLKPNILICAIIRKRDTIIPDGSATIEPDDLIIVVSKDYHFSQLKDILD
ncbi:MAG: Trk system potassium transporter TrkA [Ruminococcus sp.]|nr:Trk system potassium transporter TrkA [Ruminococcus sp.]